jgi:ribosome maturation factor RimP
MAGKSVVSIVRELLAPVFEEGEIELYDVDFLKEGANWYLRVFIDKEGGVSINDCEAVSRKAEKILDERDPIEQSYILEVSSPGIDRPLRRDSDYSKFKGERVDVRLYKAVDKKKDFTGVLEGLIDDEIVIIGDTGERLSFPKAIVAICKLSVSL